MRREGETNEAKLWSLEGLKYTRAIWNRVAVTLESAEASFFDSWEPSLLLSVRSERISAGTFKCSDRFELLELKLRKLLDACIDSLNWYLSGHRAATHPWGSRWAGAAMTLPMQARKPRGTKSRCEVQRAVTPL